MKTWIDNDVGSLRSDMAEFLMITGLATHASKKNLQSRQNQF